MGGLIKKNARSTRAASTAAPARMHSLCTGAAAAALSCLSPLSCTNVMWENRKEKDTAMKVLVKSQEEEEAAP